MESMLQAKLCMPYIGRNIVKRKKIAEKLRLLPDYKLALISAPAGYGKTTAVVDYLTGENLKFAWLSIDKADNDPLRFWRYLLSSVSQCVGNDEINRISLDLDLVLSNITVDLLISTLETLSEKFVMVLDDYHLIDNGIVLNSVEHFVRFMPQNVNQIILSRKEPEHTLSVLRARGMVISLGIKDISFDYDETTEFFVQRGIHLTEEEVDKIEKCTEGWAAGLVAASFSLRECEGIANTVSAFSGKNKNIGLILENEILAHWPGEVRDFLIHTSFLDKLSGSLCSAVTGNGNSAGLLKMLSDNNSFIIPLDTQNQWFRYHHLFQEFLLNRLELEGETVLRRLYSLAGEWYLEQGLQAEGINWLLEAGEYEKALPFILDYRFQTVLQDYEFLQWNQWIDRIPEMLYENDASVYTSYSWVASMDNKLDVAQAWAEKARACYKRVNGSLEKMERNQMEAYVISAELNVAVLKMDIPQALLLFCKLCNLKIHVPVRLGEMNWNEPSLLKTVYGFKGRLGTVKFYLPAVNLLPGLFGDFSAYFAVIVAEFYYEQNKLRELNATLMNNIATITAMKNPGLLVPCFTVLAKGKLAKGDIAGAFRTVAEAKKLLDGGAGSVWRYHLDIFMAKLYLGTGDAIGDAGSALKFLDTGKMGIFDALSCIRESEYIVYTRYLMRISRLDDALILLRRLENFAAKESRLGSKIELLCLMAVGYGMKGDYQSALEILEQALALGSKEGYARTFIDELEPMAVLLERYVTVNRNGYKNKHLTYAKSLLRSTNEYITILKSAA
ncbi:MAG TPA: hypothetical protein DDW65_06920, partial [Firmicutes bacterium]|nr:hypothetical protein [Bacillota bacterium]